MCLVFSVMVNGSIRRLFLPKLRLIGPLISQRILFLILFSCFGPDPDFLLIFLSMQNTLIPLRLRLSRRLILKNMNCRKVYKRNLLKFACAVPLALVLFFLPVLSLSVKADNVIGDPFISRTQYDRTISSSDFGSQTCTLFVPEYNYTLPFSTESYGQDSFLYSFDCSYTYNYSFFLPSNMYNQYINGSWSVPIQVQFTHKYYVSDMDGTVTSLSTSPFSDLTFRYSFSFENNLADGLSFSIFPNESASISSFYVLLTFNNYKVSNRTLSIPISIHFEGSILNEHNVSSQNLSAYNVGCILSPASYYSASGIVISGSSFQYSNDYYTILQALNNSNLSGSSSGSSALVHDILTLLENWTEDSSGVMVDFPYFADQVLSYLGSLDANTDGLEASMTTALSRLLTIMDNTDQLESYLNQIYQVVSNINFFQSVNGFQPYASIRNLLTALVCGFTGTSSSQVTTSSLSQSTYSRWVSLITEAFTNAMDLSNQQSSADETQFADQNAEVESVGSANHSYEVSLWSDVQSAYHTITGFATPPSSSTSAAVWFTGAIEYVWAHLGVFAFVISVSIVGGYLVIVLGKINQFGRVK